MTRKVEDEVSLGVLNPNNDGLSQKFLFFVTSPPELWVADWQEDHSMIRATSECRVEKDTIAGQIYFSNGLASLTALGSANLEIEEKDPTPVVLFLRSLPNVEADTILP